MPLLNKEYAGGTDGSGGQGARWIKGERNAQSESIMRRVASPCIVNPNTVLLHTGRLPMGSARLKARRIRDEVRLCNGHGNFGQ